MRRAKNVLNKLATNIPVLIILLVLLLGLCQAKQYMDGPLQEGFSPADYPVSVTEPLLHGSYETTKYAGLDPLTYRQISKNYPINSASHCGTNNVRYWDRPTNGTCAPAELCTPLYKATPQDRWVTPKAPVYGAKNRVNFYVSRDMPTKRGTRTS